jgi:hypothetical protein
MPYEQQSKLTIMSICPEYRCSAEDSLPFRSLDDIGNLSADYQRQI